MELSPGNNIQTNPISLSISNFKVLDQICLHVPAGSIFGFHSAKGAGKSAAFQTLPGLLDTEPGMNRIFGKELNTNKMTILGRIGTMAESPCLYDSQNTYRNPEITARLRNLPFNRIKPLIDTVMLTQDTKRTIIYFWKFKGRGGNRTFNFFKRRYICRQLFLSAKYRIFQLITNEI